MASILGADPTVGSAVRRLNVDEYEHVTELLGLERTELIDGVIYEMSAEYHPHVRATMDVTRVLIGRYPDKQVLNLGSYRLSDHTVVNPDVYVLDASPDANYTKYPDADLLLAVEISMSTYDRDAHRKLVSYARHGVPDYWILRPLPNGQWSFIRHSDPVADNYRITSVEPLRAGPGSITDHLKPGPAEPPTT